MNEELDDQLKSRITELFDHYEDDSANEGWLLLREKYPEKEKRRPVMWLWWGSVAALLLVFLGVGIWLNSKNTTTKNAALVINKTPVKHNPINQYHGQSSSAIAKASGNTGHIKSFNDTTAAKPNKGVARYAAAKTKAQNQLSRARNRITGGNKSNTSTQPVYGSKAAVQQANAVLAQLNNKNKDNQTPNQQPVKGTDTRNTQTDERLVTANTLAKADSGRATKSMVKAPAKSIFAMRKGEEPELKKPEASKRVKFGLYAATYFNYAKGSDNEFNVGAGMSSEIRIIGNLKLLTGVAISQNSLNYKSALPQNANSYLRASLEQPRNGNYLSAAAAPVTGSYVAFAQNTSPILQNYQASLVALDIPLNLKYQFGKSDSYISAGVSSGTYINETYQFVYNYPALSSASALSNPLPQNTKTENMLNTFDFARTLNVSFGIGYPLGKTNRLIIEPFLKYPLDGLGSQQLKFGAGGVNLKLNLQAAKK
ncbi:hypothetical protein [Mucilaginibacter paludis]|uniref:Outer membrane protein beta-barrel domain-containing protein n=1 Tax=Mucilaginibacter paludis DSM 18603 TaxID=714943 RepID=H1Y7P4_9SPHI|nr:hypothetical protein [Mucilaginibacter paludis]EHQ29889.1 hypothetical protein Mucpa_5822 [Mucilaginibacter paludis DSM 18603]